MKTGTLSSSAAVLAVACLQLAAAVDLFAAEQPSAREVQSLDGTWEIVFDPANQGRSAGCSVDATFQQLAERRRIAVPSAWELIEKDYEGVAFYRHEFEVPAGWTNKVVHLQFGAVNYLAEIWLNGEAVGFHEGGFTPFEFRVDQVLKPGKANVLMVRVVGPIMLSKKVVDGIGPMETPQWRGGLTGGIWQSVTLAATGEVRVQDVFLKPNLAERTAIFQVELDHTAVKAQTVDVVIEVVEANDPAAKVASLRKQLDLRPGVSQHAWTLAMPNAKPWSPDAPFLYQASLRVLAAGRESDRWSHRFGLREFTIRDQRFVLNGKPIYLKATFFEGLYPTGIANPDSEAMARREIQLAKDAGFNMIRPWRRPPVPGWLDLADEMGVLVVGSPALECMGMPLATPYLPARVKSEISQSVLRDRNRTCVVQWELFNEEPRPILAQMMRPMAMLTRELDPTRLVLDESGGFAFGANMYLPGEYSPTKFNDLHSYPGPFINRQLFDGFLSIGMTEEEKQALGFKGRAPLAGGHGAVAGLMSFVSELGYGSLPNLPECNERFRQQGNPLTPAYRYYHRVEQEQIRVLRESGFGQFYPKFETFCLEQQAIHGAANKRMIEAVRSNPKVQGYCIHALSAGDWILGAGLLDLWRNPKQAAYEGTQAANQPRIVAIRVLPRNVYAEKGAKLTITGVNELAAQEAVLSVQIVAKGGETILNQTRELAWGPGVTSLLEEQLKTGALAGTYSVRVRVLARNGTLLTENTHDFDVFPEKALAAPKARVAVLDLSRSLTQFLRKSGIEVVEFDPSTPRSLPVLVTSVNPTGDEQQARFARLIQFVEDGGTAVYLEGTGVTYKRGGSNQIKSPAVPLSATVERAQGLWTCIPHLVREHPIFSGLPTGGMMRDLYENVWAPLTLRDLGGETIVASIGFDWSSANHTRHYAGPGDSWWGADLAVVPHGKGRVLVSQLRLVGNLGRDPVADRILFNLIAWVAGAKR
jgi:hypothetical protein